MSKDKNHINLLVTIDRNYIGPLSVMLKSYIETNSGVTTDLYIAHSSLSEDEFFRRYNRIIDNQKDKQGVGCSLAWEGYDPFIIWIDVDSSGMVPYL